MADNTRTMAIAALSPWFGGKRKLAPEIVAALGPHNAYWEPFCGSMSVLLAKPVVPMETVNDLHGDLVNLARCVRDAVLCRVLYGKLRRTLCCQAFHDDARAYLGRDDFPLPDSGTPDVERAYQYFLASWLGRQGCAGSRSYRNHFSVRYTKNGGNSGKSFVSAVRSIPAWRRRLATVTILRLDALDLIGKIEDADGVAIYCDPPYLSKSKNYTYDIDDAAHAALAESLRRFRRSRVVVSYYQHPRLAEFYPGWHRRQYSVQRALASSVARGKAIESTAIEVLLCNQPLGCDSTTQSMFDS